MSFVKEMKQTKEEYSLAVRYNGEFAGEVVFHNMDVFGSVEIGVRLLTKFRGLGIGTEATRLATEYAKSIGATQIIMKCFKENDSSCNMIKKAGFTESHQTNTHIFFKI
jgi:RimJ/RimL family protein N-acetyltransferase